MAIALPSCSSSTSDDVCSCVLTSLAHSLPAYTPSLPAPNYSHQPACGERSLQHSLGVGFRFRNPEHTFVKNCSKCAITLRGQDPGIKTPWYGRDEVINGFVSIEDPERVTSVDLLVRVPFNHPGTPILISIPRWTASWISPWPKASQK